MQKDNRLPITKIMIREGYSDRWR